MLCRFQKATPANVIAAFRRTGIVSRWDKHAKPINTSLIAARPQKSGTDINPRRGFTSNSFQRLIENEEVKQQTLSVVQISEASD
jgi:hypothetical protein